MFSLLSPDPGKPAVGGGLLRLVCTMSDLVERQLVSFLPEYPRSLEHFDAIESQCYLTTDHFRTSYVRIRIWST
ncbi:hypothetical protein [Burkholderia anthina]|uniref:hypothetical protein n=1 Tax=Burkholderia anthina TaxID=179879 RepID=UPI001AA07A35|nr:hypothetical protein [Burkholderia anthina]QTD93966.1 hypothetical protein J4G50_24370 [Burkholderia anthina]